MNMKVSQRTKDNRRPERRQGDTGMNKKKRNRVGQRGLKSSSAGYGPVAASYEHGNEPAGAIHGRD
jgi:hypothetical protein